MTTIDVMFLRDAKHDGDPDQAEHVAQRFADFVTAARVSVDVAIYDFRLADPLAANVVGALRDAAGRGVVVRIAYDAGKPATGSPATFARLQATRHRQAPPTG